jgi:hypothetical protein
VADHVRTCATCRDELAALRTVGVLLRAHKPDVPEPAADLWARIEAQISPAGEVVPPPRRARSLWWLARGGTFPRLAGLAAAALIGVAVVTRTGWLPGPGSEVATGTPVRPVVSSEASGEPRRATTASASPAAAVTKSVRSAPPRPALPTASALAGNDPFTPLAARPRSAERFAAAKARRVTPGPRSAVVRVVAEVPQGRHRVRLAAPVVAAVGRVSPAPPRQVAFLDPASSPHGFDGLAEREQVRVGGNRGLTARTNHRGVQTGGEAGGVLADSDAGAPAADVNASVTQGAVAESVAADATGNAGHGRSTDEPGETALSFGGGARPASFSTGASIPATASAVDAAISRDRPLALFRYSSAR